MRKAEKLQILDVVTLALITQLQTVSGSNFRKNTPCECILFKDPFLLFFIAKVVSIIRIEFSALFKRATLAT